MLKLKYNPLAEYKLALIYKPFDLEKSAELIVNVFKKDPDIVNLEIYYTILDELIQKLPLFLKRGCHEVTGEFKKPFK